MANLNLANRDVIRKIDNCLEKTWDQCRSAEEERTARAGREKEHQSIMDRAISRMKSGPREKYINSVKEHGSALEARFLTPDEAGKMKISGDGGLKEFKDAISEPVAVRRHQPQGGGQAAENMVKAIGQMNGNRKK